MYKVEEGDVLVADMTDPNWEPVMRRSAAIVTNRGGRTCHAAIVAREIGVPAVVGCRGATEVLKDGQLVTVSCAEGEDGRIYDGTLEMEESRITYGELPVLPVKIAMNVGNPQMAFKLQAIPNGGVGLARLEFIINEISIHPNAVLAYPNVDPDLKKAIESVSRGYASPRTYYIHKLAEGVATIAAAFWPKPVIVRLSDFKSNEYRTLMGGTRYEPEEENPMMGFERGCPLHRSVIFRSFPHGVRSHETRTQRHGTHQCRNHGAICQNVETGAFRRRPPGGEWSQTGRKRVAHHYDVRSAVECHFGR